MFSHLRLFILSLVLSNFCKAISTAYYRELSQKLAKIVAAIKGYLELDIFGSWGNLKVEERAHQLTV
jgi:hypothetical protein